MAGGKSPKRKGDAGELEIVKMFPGAERTFWQPEQEKDRVDMLNKTRGDVLNIPYIGRAEVKRRKKLDTLYGWLADNGGLFLRADRKPWLVVMPAEDLKLILDELDEIKRQKLEVEA